MARPETRIPAHAGTAPAPDGAPDGAVRAGAEPREEMAPRGALAVSLGYFLLLALLWGLMYVDLLQRRG